MLSYKEELRFWTGIMRDHGDFILTSLSYNEQEAIKTAAYYKESFIRLHEQSKLLGENDTAATQALAASCMSMLQSLVNFKKLLLQRLLLCRLDTSLPPTFFNHMLNEAMEFYKTLCKILTGQSMNPVSELVDLHKVWLTDAAGHAATIASDLDPVEKPLIKEAREFEKLFDSLGHKALELGKMIERTCIDPNALKQLTEEAKAGIRGFICYLEKLEKLTMECRILGVLKPLIPNHMNREENHYLCQIKALVIR